MAEATTIWMTEHDVAKATGVAADVLAQWRADNLTIGEDVARGEKRALVWSPDAVRRLETWLGLQKGSVEKNAPVAAERAVWVLWQRRNAFIVDAVKPATYELRRRVTDSREFVRVRGTGRLPVGTAVLCEKAHDDLWNFIEKAQR